MKKANTKKKQIGVPGLIVTLVMVLMLGVLFVGATAGWFNDTRVKLDAEYVCGEGCEAGELMDLTSEEYEELVAEGKSFVVFVDQSGCTTADRLREYVTNWAKMKGVRVYRMMFEEARKTSMHEFVKYYPSVVVVSKGKMVGWLRADADEDADIYNNYEAFTGWMTRYL